MYKAKHDGTVVWLRSDGEEEPVLVVNERHSAHFVVDALNKAAGVQAANYLKPGERRAMLEVVR